MNSKGLHEFLHASPYFFVLNKVSWRSNVSLACKAPWQALAASHRREALLPLSAPVHRAMRSFALAGRASRRFSLIFASLFIRFSVAATAAFDAVEFATCREMLAFVTTGQMSVDVEMNDHQTPPS
jgi:hypothetical protein